MRFLLGVAEAGFFPGIILYLSYWFPARYRAGVVSLFMAAAPISVVLGSPLSSALLEMDGLLGLRGWQWMFIMEAIPAFLLGFVVLGYMTDKPEKAKWLKDDEREWLVNEMNAEHAAKAATASHSIWRGLADMRVLALSLIYFGTSAGLYTLGIWAPQIIKEFGLSTLQVGFLNAVPPTVAVIAMVLWARHSDKTERAHLARRCSLHRRGRGPCARRIGRLLGGSHCRANARQYRHQLGKAAALGHADHVPVGLCGRRRHRDHQLDRQSRRLRRSCDDWLGERSDRQLHGRSLFCRRLARPLRSSDARSLALATHSNHGSSAALRSLSVRVVRATQDGAPSSRVGTFQETVSSSTRSNKCVLTGLPPWAETESGLRWSTAGVEALKVCAERDGSSSWSFRTSTGARTTTRSTAS